MTSSVVRCRHLRALLRQPWKPGPPGTILLSLACLSILGGSLYGQGEISNDRLIAGILAHDSQIRDLDLDYEVRIGVDSDQPLISRRTWRHKGDLRYFRETRGGSSWDHSYDGREHRVLMRGQLDWPEGIITREEPTFLTVFQQSALVVMARTPFGKSLPEALGKGTARVRPEPEQVDGRDCWVVEGNTLEVGPPDRIYFRYWLDPQCGFMPRRKEQYSYDEAGVPVGLDSADEYELSEVAPGIWLPLSSRQEGRELEDGQWRRVTANLWRATRVAVNTGLRDEDLKVEFPPGTVVRDYPRPGSEEYEEYLITADGKVDRRGLDDLVGQARAASGAGPGMAVRRGESRLKWGVGGLLIAAGIGGMIFGVVRARSRSASSPHAQA